MCPCRPELAVWEWFHIMLMQERRSQPAFVIALFSKDTAVSCTTCIPRPDNDEYNSHMGRFPKLNKNSSAECGNLVYVIHVSTQSHWILRLVHRLES
jgi:hypothetical protein